MHVLSVNHCVTADNHVCVRVRVRVRVLVCVCVCAFVCARARTHADVQVMRMFSGGSMLGLSTCSRKSARKVFHK